MRLLISIVIANFRRILIFTFSTTIFLFLFLYLIYPISYNSTASLLPPETTQPMGFSSLVQNVDVLSSLGNAGNLNSQLLAEMLKSRSAAEYVVKRLNLKSYYNVPTELEACNRLTKDLSVEVSKEGVLKFSFTANTKLFSRFSNEKDSVKVLTKKVVELLIEALENINRNKNSSKARRTRLYLESQKILTKSQLDSTESLLLEFQRKNKAIALTEQVKASIEAGAKLQSEIMSVEIALGLLRQNLSEESQQIQALKAKLSELREQSKKMDSGNTEILLAFKDTPELGLKYANLLRDVKILNDVYLLLEQQYYKEKIQETKDIQTIEVLDPPVVPEKETAPRVFFHSFIGAIFSFLSYLAFLYMKNQNMFNYLRIEKR